MNLFRGCFYLRELFLAEEAFGHAKYQVTIKISIVYPVRFNYSEVTPVKSVQKAVYILHEGHDRYVPTIAKNPLQPKVADFENNFLKLIID